MKMNAERERPGARMKRTTMKMNTRKMIAMLALLSTGRATAVRHAPGTCTSGVKSTGGPEQTTVSQTPKPQSFQDECDAFLNYWYVWLGYSTRSPTWIRFQKYVNEGRNFSRTTKISDALHLEGECAQINLGESDSIPVQKEAKAFDKAMETLFQKGIKDHLLNRPKFADVFKDFLKEWLEGGFDESETAPKFHHFIDYLPSKCNRDHNALSGEWVYNGKEVPKPRFRFNQHMETIFREAKKDQDPSTSTNAAGSASKMSEVKKSDNPTTRPKRAAPQPTPVNSPHNPTLKLPASSANKTSGKQKSSRKIRRSKPLSYEAAKALWKVKYPGRPPADVGEFESLCRLGIDGIPNHLKNASWNFSKLMRKELGLDTNQKPKPSRSQQSGSAKRSGEKPPTVDESPNPRAPSKPANGNAPPPQGKNKHADPKPVGGANATSISASPKKPARPAPGSASVGAVKTPSNQVTAAAAKPKRAPQPSPVNPDSLNSKKPPRKTALGAAAPTGRRSREDGNSPTGAPTDAKRKPTSTRVAPVLPTTTANSLSAASLLSRREAREQRARISQANVNSSEKVEAPTDWKDAIKKYKERNPRATQPSWDDLKGFFKDNTPKMPSTFKFMKYMNKNWSKLRRRRLASKNGHPVFKRFLRKLQAA